MKIGAISPVFANPVVGLLGSSLKISMGALGSGAIQQTGQEMNASLISIIDSANTGSIGQGSLSSLYGFMGGSSTNGIGSLSVYGPAASNNGLKVGVTALLNAVSSVSEAPIPQEKKKLAQSIVRVAPSSGYDPNKTTDTLFDELHKELERSRSLLGNRIDIKA